MRQYRRNIRYRPDNRETYHHFLMSVNRDNTAAADLLHSMDNYAESTRRIKEVRLGRLWKKAET